MDGSVAEKTKDVATTVAPVSRGVAGAFPMAIVPRDVEEAWHYAGMVIKANMAPNSYSTPEQVLIGIVKGLELGMPPLTALASIAVINGRPTIWGDGAVAMLWKSGKVADFNEEYDPETETATCTIRRVGVETPIVRSFSAEDARRAGILEKRNSPWLTYRRRMLQMRARSWAMRDGFADVLLGLTITEEAIDQHGLDMERRDGEFQIVSHEVKVENPLDDEEPEDVAPDQNVVDAPPAGEEGLAEPAHDRIADELNTATPEGAQAVWEAHEETIMDMPPAKQKALRAIYEARLGQGEPEK